MWLKYLLPQTHNFNMLFVPSYRNGTRLIEIPRQVWYFTRNYDKYLGPLAHCPQGSWDHIRCRPYPVTLPVCSHWPKGSDALLVCLSPGILVVIAWHRHRPPICKDDINSSSACTHVGDTQFLCLEQRDRHGFQQIYFANSYQRHVGSKPAVWQAKTCPTRETKHGCVTIS